MAKRKHNRKFSDVFIYGVIAIVLIVLLGAVFLVSFGEISGSISYWITEYFGRYYMILTTLLVFFCVFNVMKIMPKAQRKNMKKTWRNTEKEPRKILRGFNQLNRPAAFLCAGLLLL